MCAAVRVVLDALHCAWPGLQPAVVHRSDSSCMSSASMPDRDSAAVVAASFAVPFLRECEWVVRFAFPEMVVDGSFQMPHARSSRFVCTQDNVLLPPWG